MNASGSTNDAVSPHMNLVVADTTAGFDVAGGFSELRAHVRPARRHLLRSHRVQQRRARGQSPADDRQSDDLGRDDGQQHDEHDDEQRQCTGGGRQLHRQLPAGASQRGALGASHPARRSRSAWSATPSTFGTMVQGFDANVFLAPVAPGDTTSTAARYQNFVNSHFNILVPSNMGKWQPNENTQNVPTMGHVDTILNYAEVHNMNVRMHNLIWGTQQPTWVNTLITNAASRRIRRFRDRRRRA